jgi:hypothetical protein
MYSDPVRIHAQLSRVSAILIGFHPFATISSLSDFLSMLLSSLSQTILPNSHIKRLKGVKPISHFSIDNRTEIDEQLIIQRTIN